MGGLARDLKNDDTTLVPFKLFMDQITSPVTADIGATRIDVGTSTTYVPMDASNPIYAQLTAGTALVGKVGIAATDPKTSAASSVAVAAGGTASLDSSQISADKTGHLLQARASASVPWKAELQTVANGVASATLAVWFWNDPLPLELIAGAITVAYDATAGLDGFRIVVTNLDPVQTADLYAFFVWDEQ